MLLAVMCRDLLITELAEFSYQASRAFNCKNRRYLVTKQQRRQFFILSKTKKNAGADVKTTWY